MPAELRKLYSQTVVINTRNDAMKALLEYKEKQKLEEVDDMLATCLHECYHLAVLSAMDIVPPEWLQHHVEHQCGLIIRYVQSKSELADEQDHSAKLQRELDEKRDKLDEDRKARETLETCFVGINADEVQAVPLAPQNRFGVVVVCDLIGSTESLLRMDFERRGELMNKFVEAAKAKVREHGGFFDKFTGDGIMALFGTNCIVPKEGTPSLDVCKEAAEQAWAFQLSLGSEIERLDISELVKRIRYQNNSVSNLRTRIAIDAGSISFGRYGGLGTAVGIPVITAFRLCGEKEAYHKAKGNILVTESFANYYDPKAFEVLSYEFMPKGLNASVKVCFKPPGT